MAESLLATRISEGLRDDIDREIVGLNESNSKAFGKLDLPPIPEFLSQVGYANPQVKAAAKHAFATLKGRYTTSLTELLVNKKLAQARREKKATDLIKDYFLRAYRMGMMAGAGIKKTPKNFDLTPAQHQWLNRATKEEVGYFLKFWKDTTGMSYEAVARRIQMYVDTLDSLFTSGSVSVVSQDKPVVIHWVVNHLAEHCVSCLYLEKFGPYTAETLPCVPRDGMQKCRTNCRCTLRFEEVSKARYAQVERKTVTKRQHLSRLSTFK